MKPLALALLALGTLSILLTALVVGMMAAKAVLAGGVWLLVCLRAMMGKEGG